jgi:nickel and cobalt resistance protein CnrR
MSNRRGLLGIALIAFVAALVGVFIGRAILAPPSPAMELHAVLHEQLELSPEQERQLEQIEAGFAVRRRELELELRAANARLAAAIQAEHGQGPRVAAAVDASHEAMGQLQKDTLAHIFAMRKILTPAQAAKFDRAVVDALTADAR